MTSTPVSSLSCDNTGKPHIAKLFRSLMDELSIRQVNGVDLVVLQGTRIVVLLPARTKNAHSGLTKSILTAQQLYYWPGHQVVR